MPQLQKQGGNWLAIVNPTGGGGAVQRLWPRLEKAFQEAGFRPSVRFTECRGHATRLVTEGIREGFDQFLAVGGDGTFHEVANGILSQDLRPSTELGLALFPIGTGNDWRKTWKVPVRPGAWLRMLWEGHFQFQDAGRITFISEEAPESCFFVNVAGLAYDGYLVREIENAGLKSGNGLFYILMILKHLFRFEPEPCLVRTARGQWQDRFFAVNLGICRYSGGGLQMVPHAVPTSGKLALTIVGNISSWNVLRNAWKLYTGGLLHHPAVLGSTEDWVEVLPAGNSPIFIEADGEFLGQAPVRLEVLPGALKVLVPDLRKA